MSQDFRDKLINYFKELSKFAGRDKEKSQDQNAQAGYSLYWYFENCIDDDIDNNKTARYSPVLDAYLGAEISDIEIEKVFHPAQIDNEKKCEIDEQLANLFPPSDDSLNANQTEAVYKALNYPMSLIKGPPGTGKTKTIVRIASLAVNRGDTVAIVSTNSEAVKNVENKLDEALNKHKKDFSHSNENQVQQDVQQIGQTDLEFKAACSHVSLGRSDVREKACDPIKKARDPKTKQTLGFKSGEHAFQNGNKVGGWEQSKHFKEFTQEKEPTQNKESKKNKECTQKYPLITCTIHSLKKCFCDGDEEKYDLLIMDEASQTNLWVGIVALSCAKRIVLVGDEEQLPPVMTDEENEEANNIAIANGFLESESDNSENTPFHPYDAHREDFSFLDSCYEIFVKKNKDLRTMLVDHYRCHPTIIGFCNEEIYNNKLIVHSTGQEYSCPISITWYEGDYRERIIHPEASREEGPSKKNKTTCVNRKQLAILRQEESDNLCRFIREGKSICILSPFRGQIELLKSYLEELKAQFSFGDIHLETTLATNNSTEDTSNEKTTIDALTIHKSQGREFDIVYLLPVEDGNWEWPWSQNRRLINVAASRAKEQLRVIISTKFMEETTQKTLTGRVVQVKDSAKDEDDVKKQHMFVRKLVEYTRREIDDLSEEDRAKNEDAGFGLKRSSVISIFDEIPYLQNSSEKSYSAPEKCMELALCNMKLLSEENLTWAKNVTFNCLRADNASSGELLSNLSINECKNAEEKHFDFVIFERDTRRVITAIEVDGGHHRFKRTQDGMIDLGVIVSDDQKDHIAKTICGASLAWLGPMNDGSYVRAEYESGREMEYFEKWAEQNNLEPKQLQILKDDWAHSPDDIKDDSSFVLLRIPSDGSTYWETDALQEIAVRTKQMDSSDDAHQASLKHATIEDFIRKQNKISKQNNCAAFYVSEEVESKIFVDTKNITQCLKEWMQDEKLAPLLAKITPKDMNQCLREKGFNYLRDNDKNQRLPTQKGIEIGIRCKNDIDSKTNEPYIFPVYPPEARKYIANHMEEILEPQAVNNM